MADCLFCRIAAGEISADEVYEDDQVVAFRDINPQAPVHLLVIPRRHIASLSEAEEREQDLLGHLCSVAAQIAKQEGLTASGYRVVINSGPDSGQEVNHLHLHVLGGRKMSWPPG